MKIYKGAPTEHRRNVRVFVDKDAPYFLPLRLDIENKSPSGFAWGYGGSGPHQLALALLADFTQDRKQAQRLMHDLVVECISGLDGDKPWEISGDWLGRWVASKVQGVPLK